MRSYAKKNLDNAQSIALNRSYLANAVFSREFYSEQNQDVSATGVDPFQHFVNDGFYERRNPAPWVELATFFEFYHSDSDAQISVDEFFEFAAAANHESLFWVSSLVCPAWIMKQLGGKNGKFVEFLETTIPESGISLHPCLAPIIPNDEISTVLDAIRSLPSMDLGRMSAVDLSKYREEHSDLIEFSDMRLFSHLWTFGFKQNRLKYLGGSSPRNRSVDELYLNYVALALNSSEKSHQVFLNARTNRLPRYKIAKLTKLPEAWNQLTKFSSSRPDTWLSTDEIMDVAEIFWKKQTNASAIEVSNLKTFEISDADLLSGAYSIETDRVVYSINLGDYDDLPIPPILDNTTYVLITDKLNVPTDTPWLVVRPSIKEAEPKRTCLWYKTHPHKLFPNAKFVTWIDSNVECHTGSENLLLAHEMLSEVATFAHPDRDCIYEEAEAVVNLKLDYSDVIDSVLEKFEAAEMPKNNGLFETNVLFVRNQEMAVQRFLEKWWELIVLGSRRDQLSFTFSAYLNDIQITHLDGQNNTKNSRYFSKAKHSQVSGRFV